MNTHNINAYDFELFAKVISFYTETVNLFSDKLAKELKIKDISGWRSVGAPMSGKFDNDSFYYTFHGTGCFIEYSGIEVDFEFDIDSSVGGVDLWRLYSFICDNEEKLSEFEKFKDKKYLEKTFKAAIESEVITSIINGKKHDLYYLSS